jgi:hypothetical protein
MKMAYRSFREAAKVSAILSSPGKFNSAFFAMGLFPIRR